MLKMAFFSRSLVKVCYYTDQNSIFTNSFKMDTETRSGVYLFTLNLNIIEIITKLYCLPSGHIICVIQPAADKIQCEDLPLKVNSMCTELNKYPLRNLYEYVQGGNLCKSAKSYETFAKKNFNLKQSSGEAENPT